MKRTTRLILIAVSATAVIAGGVMVSGAFNSAAANTAPTKTSRPGLSVEVTHPSKESWPLTMSANGALAAWHEATISTETVGLRITALHVDVGSRVKRGQLLAELNNDAVKAEVLKAEAAVALAKANRREAEANARRGAAVKDSGALSGQQIEQYEIAAQGAKANLASAEASLTTARINLGRTRIVAVDNGIISSRTATLGTVVNVGSELFRLVRDERVEWRAEVDASQLAHLVEGQKAFVTLPAGDTVQGQVRQLSPTLDAKTRTAFAYVDLPIEARIRAGAYVTGRIDLGQQPALTVPSTAVVMRDGRSYVFELDSARSTVIQKEVVTGRSLDDRIEILSGVASTASLVSAGGAFLNDGDIVRISGKDAS